MAPNHMTRLIRGVLLLAMTLLTGLAATAQAAAPEMVNYQAFLQNPDGTPIDGLIGLRFKIFDAATGGTLLWDETYTDLQVDEGLFHVALGSQVPLTESIFSGGDRWLETTIAGDSGPLVPRRQFLATPYALHAAVADVALSGGDVDDDWIIEGDDVYRANGSVGIGTDSPSADLHVSGGEGSASIRIDADILDTDDDAHPSLIMSQDRDVIRGEVGFFDGNAFALRQMNTNLMDTVSVVIGGTSSNNVSMNADLEIGGGSSGSSDASSEALVIRAESKNWYVGAENDAAPGNSDFFVGQVSSGDGTLHIESDGDVGIGTSTPSSKLSVVGDVDAESYEATVPLGDAAQPAVGGVYADNVIYGWAKVRGDGVILDSFGISGVNHFSVGSFEVLMERTLPEGVCATVTPWVVNDPVIATASTSTDRVDVKIRIFIGGNHNFQLVDYGFYIMIVGRPS